MEDQRPAVASCEASLDKRYVSFGHVQKINPHLSYRKEGEPWLADILSDWSLPWYA
jgi:hypothetical protein